MAGRRLPTRVKITILWIIVAIEILSPLPGALSIGAIYVLVERPAWFYRLVGELYGKNA